MTLDQVSAGMEKYISVNSGKTQGSLQAALVLDTEETFFQIEIGGR